MKVSCVTTFSNKGYEEYAHRMMDSWVKNWAKDITLHVYHDVPHPQFYRQFPPNVKLWNFDPKDLRDFRNRNKNNPKQKYGDDMYDGIKFCHKAFAFVHQCEKLIDLKEQILIFLDADIITHSPVTANEMVELLDGKLGACLSKPNMPTDTSFHIIDLDHGDCRQFVKELGDYYRKDKIWDLEAHTDCYAYDEVRKHVGEEKFTNLTSSLCSKWMDHHKGERKKEIV